MRKASQRNCYLEAHWLHEVLAAKLAELTDQLASQHELIDALRCDVFEVFASIQDENDALDPLLTVRDVARILSVSQRTIKTMLATGEIPPPIWVGGQRRWTRNTISAFVRSREERR